MDQEGQFSGRPGKIRVQEIQDALRRLERRDLWLWLGAVMVMLLLTVALATFSVPTLLSKRDFSYEFNLGQALRGLFGLMLLFSVYVVYQQVQIRRLRQQLSEQVAMLAQLEVKAEEFYQLATLDPLTGLYNRRAAEQNLDLEISRSGRHDYALTVLALDLDSLKEVNDKHGHAAGDLVLKAFSARLKKAIRSSDFPARMGGDEFLVILPECHADLVPRVLARLSGLEVEIEEKNVPVVFSAGWAGYQPGERADQVLERADNALYGNKRTGKVEQQVRRAREQMRESQKMEAMGRLVGGVAHDFNNLLMMIKGYSELVLERLPKEEPLRRHVEAIQNASERANLLTRQILSFGRRQALEPHTLSLNEIIPGMKTMLTRLVGEGINLELNLASDLGYIHADPGQMEQIILHLVANARDAMPDGGRVTIKTTNVEIDAGYAAQHPGAKPGWYILVSVTDTGAGLDPDTQEHLFEPKAGAGKPGDRLLLASVYGIVKQSGGYIAVESERGKGTTLSIHLPRAEPAEEDVEPGTRETAPDGAETVLVVEDEEALLKLAREFLEDSGYHVLEARNGIEALEVSDGYEGRIHAVLTDVVMPKMNGWELAKRLSTRRPETKVLYCSGYADDTVVRQGLLDPEVNFLRKPFTLETLQQTLRGVLDGKLRTTA
jgi:diguanylate cyclase (GGDEF)-like protein